MNGMQPKVYDIPKVSHEGEVWTIEALWKCALCHVAYSMRKHAFNDKFEFEDHIARYCHICNVELTSVEALNQHFQTQHTEGQKDDTTDKNLCQFCGMSAFESSEELEKHVKTGHPLYKCLGCDKSFLQFCNFNSHVVTCKSSWKESISSYVIYDCGSCHQFSISLKDLYMHYLKCYAKIQDEMRNTLMSEGNIKEAIKQRVNELGTRKNIPYILIKAPQSDIMPAQKPCPAKEPGFKREAPLRSQDLSVSPRTKKSIPSILVRPTTRKFHENNSNGLPKKDFDPLTKSPSQEGNAFMSKSLLTMDDSRCPKDKSEFHQKNIEAQSPFPVPVSIPNISSNDSLNPIFSNEDQDPLSLQITSVLSVGDLIDDLDNPSDIVIEKILKFASRRRDILEKIVLDNSEQVNEILVKHGKLRSNQQQEKNYDTSDYYSMLESQDFHWTDYTKKVHKFKPCSVRMKRLKVRNNPKKKVFTITPTNVPTFYLPLFLNNFDLLDCQGPAEKCRATKIYGSKKKNVSTENVLGYQNNDWLSQDDSFENISMIVENPSSGETSQSWCGMSSTLDN